MWDRPACPPAPISAPGIQLWPHFHPPQPLQRQQMRQHRMGGALRVAPWRLPCPCSPVLSARWGRATTGEGPGVWAALAPGPRLQWQGWWQGLRCGPAGCLQRGWRVWMSTPACRGTPRPPPCCSTPRTAPLRHTSRGRCRWRTRAARAAAATAAAITAAPAQAGSRCCSPARAAVGKNGRGPAHRGHPPPQGAPRCASHPWPQHPWVGGRRRWGGRGGPQPFQAARLDQEVTALVTCCQRRLPRPQHN